MKKPEYVLPEMIEAKSFEIIEEELKNRQMVLKRLSSDEDCPIKTAPVIKRVIHTTADFDYVDNLMFSDDALTESYRLFTSGCVIVTDTNMALSGINKTALGTLGIEAHCYMADPDVASEAKERGVTRAYVSMERAMKSDKPVIYAIGNAPTALISIMDIYDTQEADNDNSDPSDKQPRSAASSEIVYNRPGLVIGVPVGFVNVTEAKELIMDSDLPYIVAKGRKGGSNVAAAIVNAMMYQLTR